MPSPRKRNLLIDVARVVSVGRDRTPGGAVIRLRDQSGRMVAARLRPQQFFSIPVRTPIASISPAGVG